MGLAGLLVMGCAQFDTGASAQRALAEHLGCPEERVQMTQIGAYRYRGEGCGREATVACTASQLEPQCLHEGPTTAGGEWTSDEEGSEEPRVVQPDPDAHRQPAVSGEPSDEPAGDATAGLTDPPDAEVESQIRAGLDARRDDVLACTGAERVAVRAGYAPDGSVALSLQGELEGTPEERCVQDALDGVRVPATGGAGVVVHLIRR